jgi:hypothetical protein
MTRTLSIVVAIVLLAALPAHAHPLRVSVRDAATGAFVDARLRVGADQDERAVVVRGCRVALDVPADSPLVFSAPAYSSLQTHVASGTGDLQIWLDPLAARVRAPDLTDQRARIEGHVYDLARGQALAGATIELGTHRSVSAADGAFAIELNDVDRASGTALDLTVRAERWPAWQQRLRVVSGVTHLIVDLGGGAAGADHRFDTRVAMLDLPEPADPSRAPVVAPPDSIRVGFADAGFTTPCCVGACNAVSAMSLETYVRRGLNDEWIASWTGDSLRAGAIAYRSYGAWHVANPRTPTYDICSSACCQVNDPDTSASSNAAVDATAGIVLTQGGAIFRAEYSAENNAWDDPNDGLDCSNADLTCGNGFVGSPAAGWPCLADSVASGHGCFGHGRGMSQWGSQRWALNDARRWPWIVDHYYNANGTGAGLRTAVLTSPLRIDQLLVPPVAAPGQTITFSLTLANLAAQAHDPVWIGASLYSVATGYVSDPARDAGVRLDPGTQARTRDFLLPAGLAAGSYDVLVALYLDIDGNGAINSGDLALTTLRQDAVLAVGQGVFVDGFE